MLVDEIGEHGVICLQKLLRFVHESANPALLRQTAADHCHRNLISRRAIPLPVALRRQ